MCGTPYPSYCLSDKLKILIISKITLAMLIKYCYCVRIATHSGYFEAFENL